MNPETRPVDRRWLLALVIGAPLMAAAGAAGMYVYLRVPATPPADSPAPATAAPATTVVADHDVGLTLTPDAVARAGIQTSTARLGQTSRDLAAPGIVEPNAYRHVVVTTVAAGQVRSVAAELGARVRQGQVLATIHSPDLAESQRAYVSMRADLEAAHQRMVRLEGLVKIGAAGREELEVARAEHTRHATDVEGARARLMLLGLTADQVNALVDASHIDPVMTVASPIGGVVIRRTINRGQNVDASTELFTVVDLSTVWIVGDLYERDLGRVRVGSSATMTSAALPGQTWKGKVSYIDAQLAPETRTARVRVETSNPGERLRLGMYLDMLIRDASPASVLMVPRAAIQTIGNQRVVYVADPTQPGRFIERVVRLGGASDDDVEVAAGLTEGERVVTVGTFFLRAERDRLGLPPPVQLASSPGRSATAAPMRVEIAVTKEGFVPDRVTVPAGAPIDLVFTRQTDETCATEVALPTLKVRKTLPLKKPVVIQVTPKQGGEIVFACGMDMLRGTIVVR